MKDVILNHPYLLNKEHGEQKDVFIAELGSFFTKNTVVVGLMPK